jgi:glycosyltransferase involved in cell wall biosynthesis
MTVGFHSPLPPAATGVADYSAALLEQLRRRGRVELGEDGAVNLYHIGNNQLHREIYRRAVERPGVVVLHDAVLQHLFLGWLDRGAYVEEFVYNYGEWRRSEAAALWDGRRRSASQEQHFRYPMLKRIAETARAVVVHNPAAATMVRRHAPQARVVVIPHLLLETTTDVAEAERLRASWGFPGGRLVFSVLGFLRETKRLHVVLKALDEVRQQGMNAALVVAGAFASSDLERAVRPRLTRGGVRYMAWSEPARFQAVCAAVDACVNLRYPAAGETSGIAMRLMGLGKPVILSDGEETAAFPPQVCLRVAHGPGDFEELVECMMMLALRRDLAREIGRQAREYVWRAHAPETVARAYWELLCDCRD